MRWKERFLVPDHRVRDINGASFAGICYFLSILSLFRRLKSYPSFKDSIMSVSNLIQRARMPASKDGGRRSRGNLLVTMQLGIRM